MTSEKVANLWLKSAEYLKSKGVNFESINLDSVPHSAQDVVEATECSLSNVLKTLLFIADRNPVITIVSGDKRADMAKLAKLFPNANIRMAKPDEVLNLTGYKVGEVSPFGIENIEDRIIDKKVLDLDYVIIGSGQGNLLYKLSKEELTKAWEGTTEELVQE